MKYKITWDTNMRLGGHRDSPADPRPTEVEADTMYTIYSGGENPYPLGLQFNKPAGKMVLTVFDLPLMVEAVSERSEESATIADLQE